MKRIWFLVFAVIFVIFFAVDFWLRGGPEHGYFPWSHVPAVFAVFGFVACVVIVVISKLLGHYWLQRKENYYDRNDGDE